MVVVFYCSEFLVWFGCCLIVLIVLLLEVVLYWLVLMSWCFWFFVVELSFWFWVSCFFRKILVLCLVFLRVFFFDGLLVFLDDGLMWWVGGVLLDLLRWVLVLSSVVLKVCSLKVWCCRCVLIFWGNCWKWCILCKVIVCWWLCWWLCVWLSLIFVCCVCCCFNVRLWLLYGVLMSSLSRWLSWCLLIFYVRWFCVCCVMFEGLVCVWLRWLEISILVLCFGLFVRGVVKFWCWVYSVVIRL